MKRIAVLSDVHVPFHDAKSYELFIKVAKSWKPDILVIIGDFCDFHAVSSHLKTPGHESFLQEVLVANKELDKITDLAKRTIFTAGNHCNRLERFLKERAPELYGIVSVEELLELKRRKIEYYPYQQEVTVGNVSFVHDLGYAGVNASRQMAAAYPGNIVFGHTHRFNSFTMGNLKHETYTAWNIGWLGDPKKIDYLPSVKVKTDWTKGFMLIYMDDSGNPFFHPCKITNNSTVVDGKIINL